MMLVSERLFVMEASSLETEPLIDEPTDAAAEPVRVEVTPSLTMMAVAWLLPVRPPVIVL